MSHSLTKIWIHAIWSTKLRAQLIEPKIEKKVHTFLAKELNQVGCPVRIINGMPDHVHCLFRLSSKLSIAQVVKQIKGSCAHFINQNDLIAEKFSWQTGYAAYSVSESVLEHVYAYILNQKKHHSKKTFDQEYNELLAFINPA